jgi:hypothetical protein
LQDLAVILKSIYDEDASFVKSMRFIACVGISKVIPTATRHIYLDTILNTIPTYIGGKNRCQYIIWRPWVFCLDSHTKGDETGSGRNTGADTGAESECWAEARITAEAEESARTDKWAETSESTIAKGKKGCCEKCKASKR